MKKKFSIKNKIYSHLLKNGQKETCEKILIKTTKNLQKTSKKNSKNIINTTIFLTTPVFKIFIFTKKRKRKKTIREMPFFLLKKNSPTSFAIKLILKVLKKKKNSISETLKNEFLLGSKSLNESLKIKNNLNESVILKKNVLRYYKW